MKMNKHGFILGEEALKLVIAAISIAILIYFLVSGFFSYQYSQELKQAKASLNLLMDEVLAGKTTVNIFNPKGWWIESWSGDREESLSGSRILIYEAPKSCASLNSDSCICFCKEQDKAASCYNGACLADEGFFIDEPIQILNPPITLEIDQINKNISKQ